MTTTNLGMSLPTDQASDDVWGAMLLACLAILDAAVVPTRYSNFTNTSTYAQATATYKMGGFGSSWAITKSAYTTRRVRVRITGTLLISGTGTGYLLGRYGTGSAPAQGDAAAGTAGTTGEIRYSGASAEVPFTIEFDVTGLSASTAYWFDLAMKSDGSVTATVRPVSVVIEEIF